LSPAIAATATSARRATKASNFASGIPANVRAWCARFLSTPISARLIFGFFDNPIFGGYFRGASLCVEARIRQSTIDAHRTRCVGAPVGLRREGTTVRWEVWRDVQALPAKQIALEKRVDAAPYWHLGAYPLFCIWYVDEPNNGESSELDVSDRRGRRSSNIHINRRQEVSELRPAPPP
jgi:hypothetical protein